MAKIKYKYIEPFTLKNVTVIFGDSIFKPGVMKNSDGTQKQLYSVGFYTPENGENHKKLLNAFEEAKQAFLEKKVKDCYIPYSKIRTRQEVEDSAEEKYIKEYGVKPNFEYLEGMVQISINSREPIEVYGQHKNILTEEHQKWFKRGAVVNVVLNVWCEPKSENGKKVHVRVLAIQLVKKSNDTSKQKGAKYLEEVEVEPEEIEEKEDNEEDDIFA